MQIIDIHTHIFPDQISETAIRTLERTSDTKTHLNGTAGALRRSMRRAGIRRAVVQPVSTKPSQVRSINEWAHQSGDETLIFFGTLYPGMEGWREEIGWLKAREIKGVKFHPDYQNFFVDDPMVFPIYEELEKQGLIVLFHAGVDIGLPSPVHAPPDRIAKVLDRFPNLKVIASHLGGYQCWDDVDRDLVGRNLFFDTSYTLDHLEASRALEIMRGHGFERILFGTDSPWEAQDDQVRKVSRLDLDEGAKAKIFGENAARLLGLG